MDELSYILWNPCHICRGEKDLCYVDIDNEEREYISECWRCMGDGGWVLEDFAL